MFRAVLATLLSVVLLLNPAPAQAIGETTFRNPLVANGADPWLQYHNGNYYLATTTWTQQLVMRKSPTITGLSTAPAVNIWADTDAANCCNHWAPEFHRLTGPNGTRWYYMYTSGRNGTFDYQHLSVLESAGDDPMGPYRHMGSPLGTNWNIDGSYLQLNGQLYLLWSEFVGSDQSLWIARMSNPWTVTGPSVVISRPTHSWETQGLRVNEAPEVLQRNGRTFLIYSASYCATQHYKLGMLTLNGADPMSPASWTKSPNPVFQSANGVYGPGHNGFFTSPDGSQSWIVYHGNASSSQGCSTTRSTRAQPFTWNADGTPNFGAPVSTATNVNVPSGERGPITTAVRGPVYQLVNRNSGMCAGGVDVVQVACGGATTEWVLDSTADGYYRLVNRDSNNTLDAVNCGTADGTDVRQLAWMDNSCQQWQVTPTSDGWFRLGNRNSGKTLDVAECGTASGANVRLWTWLNSNCQQWRLQPIGVNTIVNANSGKLVDTLNCSTSSGADVRQQPFLNTACQKWTFTHTDNGYYQVRPTHASGLCLIVNGGSTADGADIVQGACSGNHSQWRVEPQADGSVRFVARHSGKVMDVNSCGLANGTNIAQWSWLNNNCQKFRLMG
ncbi:RICIN domain-containing protein [Allorhizocola rhizosphaerae]|uniref:RICIN domain-containing protein n=1 Tax=Allorhizocola rhizosphaerae TaxID=1872709 RepID=UPI000E3DC370|nr:family 43 glycosylhydrolase [Allorhizocola rhizosphaerae]